MGQLCKKTAYLAFVLPRNRLESPGPENLRIREDSPATSHLCSRSPEEKLGGAMLPVSSPAVFEAFGVWGSEKVPSGGWWLSPVPS
jgi:hypothetical protein